MVRPKRSNNKLANADKADGRQNKKSNGSSDLKNDEKSVSYKKKHNIGNRKATNLANSYKESDVVVLFDKNYFSNFRYNMTFGRGSRERLKSSPRVQAGEDQDTEMERNTASRTNLSANQELSSRNKNSTRAESSKVEKRSKRLNNSQSRSDLSPDSPPCKRPRRTASLNAGAILTAMLEKVSPALKKSKDTPSNDFGDKQKLFVESIPTTAGQHHNQSFQKTAAKSQMVTISNELKSVKEKESKKDIVLKKSLVSVCCSPIEIEKSREHYQTDFTDIRGKKDGLNQLTKSQRKSSAKKKEGADCVKDLHGMACNSDAQKKTERWSLGQRLSDCRPEASQANVMMKLTRSPTLSSSSSSSATILNFEGNSSSNDGATKKSKASNKNRLNPEKNLESASILPLKTSRRLASLNAKAVLAACLDVPKRAHKTKKDKPQREEVAVDRDGDLANCSSTGANLSGSINDNTHNIFPGCNKKSGSKKRPYTPALVDRVSRNSAVSPESSGLGGIPACHVHSKLSVSSHSTSLPSPGATRPSKSSDRKQTTRVSPWKNIACSTQSHSRSNSSGHLLVSTPALSPPRQSMVGHLHQTQRQFSTGRPSSSAVVATILPHVPSQICFARPTPAAFHGYSRSGGPTPVTSLLLPRQHFPSQTHDAGLLPIPYLPDGKYSYQNFGVLQCGAGGIRQNVHGSFPAQQPYHFAPPTATVLFGAPQQHINLQLGPPMAFGQVCRQFSPSAPSFYQTVPFSPERFQICHTSSSSPLSLSSPASQLFIPYGGISRNHTTPPSNLNSPGGSLSSASSSKATHPNGQTSTTPQAQGKKRTGKGRSSGGTNASHSSSLGLQNSPTFPIYYAGKSVSHSGIHPQYVRISPKKTENPTLSPCLSHVSPPASEPSHPQPTSSSSSVVASECRKILLFSDEVIPVRVSESPVPSQPASILSPKVPSADPGSSSQSTGKVKSKKRAHLYEQKDELVSAKRVQEDRTSSNNAVTSKHETSSSKGRRVSKSSPTLTTENEGTRLVVEETSRTIRQENSIQNGSSPSVISHEDHIFQNPASKNFDYIKTTLPQDANIDCSVVIMTSSNKPGVCVGGRPFILKDKATPQKNGSSSHVCGNITLLPKNRSPAMNRGPLKSVKFLKNRSPGKSFMVGSHNRANRREGRSQKEIKGKEKCQGMSSRKNGMNKEKMDKSSFSSKKLNFSSSQAKNSTERISSWSWIGSPALKTVSVQGDGTLVKKVCYNAIQHVAGDIVKVRDCVFVRSGTRKKDIPYIAKIYGLWEEGEMREMMMGVFWYYRREHIDSETVASRYLDEEVFASRHRDVVPVACIEDKCFVLPFNQYCRFRAEVSRLESGASESLSSITVPLLFPATVHPSLLSIQSTTARSLTSSASMIFAPHPLCMDSTILSSTPPLSSSSSTCEMDFISSTTAALQPFDTTATFATELSGKTVPVVSQPIVLDTTSASVGVDASLPVDDVFDASVLVAEEIRTSVAIASEASSCEVSTSSRDVIVTPTEVHQIVAALHSQAGVNPDHDARDAEATKVDNEVVGFKVTSCGISATTTETNLSGSSPTTLADAKLANDVKSLRTLCNLTLNAMTSDSGHQCFYFESQPPTLSSLSSSNLITVFSTSTVVSASISLSSLETRETRANAKEFATESPPPPASVPRLSDLSLSVVGTSTNSHFQIPSPIISVASSASKIHFPLVPHLPSTPTLMTNSLSPILAATISEPSFQTFDVKCPPRYASLTDYLAKEIDRDNVFLCRHIYDIKLRRISKNPQILLLNAALQPSQHPVEDSSAGGITSEAR